MLGREAVVDREHVHVGIAADSPAQAVMSIEIAGNETAAVVVDEQGLRRTGWRIVPCADCLAATTVDDEIADRADRDRPTGNRQSVPAQLPPRFTRYRIEQASRPQQRAERQDELHLRMQCHPIDGNGWAARQAHLNGWRQRQHHARRPEFEMLA